MKRLFFIALLLAGIFSCRTEQKSDVVEIIPNLLERPEAIRYGKEWDEVQNQYAAYVNNIRQGNKVAESYLNMAALFTTEARITGEHGHYYPASLWLIEQAMSSSGLSDDLRFYSLATKAGVLMNQHEFSKALETARMAIQINSHNAMIYGVLADAFVELGDYENAIQAVDKMVSIRPDLRSYSRVSYIREILGMEQEAIEAMQMAVDAGAPGSEEKAWCQLQLVGLYEKIGDSKTAEAICDDILAEREDYPFAVAKLGSLMIARGERVEGLALLEKACDIIPEVGFYIDLAKYHKEADHVAQADSLSKEILVMIEDDIQHGHKMDLELGHVYADLFDDYPKAIALFQTEYERRPGNVEVNRSLADVYTRIGNASKAAFHASKASVNKDMKTMKVMNNDPFAGLQ